MSRIINAGSLMEFKFKVDCGFCGGDCGKASAYWQNGDTIIYVCRDCAINVLPKLIGDTIDFSFRQDLRYYKARLKERVKDIVKDIELGILKSVIGNLERDAATKRIPCLYSRMNECRFKEKEFCKVEEGGTCEDTFSKKVHSCVHYTDDVKNYIEDRFDAGVDREIENAYERGLTHGYREGMKWGCP